MPGDEKFKKQNIPVAILLEGKFASLFRNRISGLQMDSLTVHGTPFLEHTEEDNKMIIVADGDMVMNDFSPRRRRHSLPMG